MDTNSVMERRTGKVTGDNRKMIGHPVVFNVRSQNLGGFYEIIAPSAVDRTINAGDEVQAFVAHDQRFILASTRSGTLQLRKEATGLRAVIEPDMEISYAADTMRSVARGDLRGMSFGFRVVEEDWNYDEATPVRTVLDMRLYEVSIVASPAYLQTDVQAAMRSLDAFRSANPQRTAQWYESRIRLAR